MKPRFGRRRPTGGAFLVREKNVSNNRSTHTHSNIYNDTNSDKKLSSKFDRVGYEDT